MNRADTEMLGVDEPHALPAVSAHWRIEVQKRGRFWQWRKGSHQNRQAKYGGKFELLSDERKQAYEHNKARLQMHQTTAGNEMSETPCNNGTRGTESPGERGELLPVGGVEHPSDEQL